MKNKTSDFEVGKKYIINYDSLSYEQIGELHYPIREGEPVNIEEITNDEIMISVFEKSDKITLKIKPINLYKGEVNSNYINKLKKISKVNDKLWPVIVCSSKIGFFGGLFLFFYGILNIFFKFTARSFYSRVAMGSIILLFITIILVLFIFLLSYLIFLQFIVKKKGMEFISYLKNTKKDIL